MSSGDSWDERRKAKEDQFFEKANRDALARLQARESKPRLSPITGEPMEQLTFMGVTIDRCTTSGGIFLDAGELETIIRASQAQPAHEREGWLANFMTSLFTRKI